MMNTRGFGVLRPRSTRSAARRALVAATTSALALGLSATSLGAGAAAAQASTATAPDTYEKRVQRLVNVRRSNHDLPRLRMAACADNVAEDWSSYLAMNGEFFHQSMSDVLDRCDATYAGETLGRGSMTPRKLVRMWMQSPGHRAVLLSSKSRRIGVGATPDAKGRWVVAANFIRF
ncbi:MAG TPA: CAP domain-containing protein [Nocardioidaceae bacterium]|nr:CAP domain-containing protein [Nocardioidaceae bacterium]